MVKQKSFAGDSGFMRGGGNAFAGDPGFRRDADHAFAGDPGFTAGDLTTPIDQAPRNEDVPGG